MNSTRDVNNQLLINCCLRIQAITLNEFQSIELSFRSVVNITTIVYWQDSNLHVHTDGYKNLEKITY